MPTMVSASAALATPCVIGDGTAETHSLSAGHSNPERVRTSQSDLKHTIWLSSQPAVQSAHQDGFSFAGDHLQIVDGLMHRSSAGEQSAFNEMRQKDTLTGRTRCRGRARCQGCSGSTRQSALQAASAMKHSLAQSRSLKYMNLSAIVAVAQVACALSCRIPVRSTKLQSHAEQNVNSDYGCELFT